MLEDIGDSFQPDRCLICDSKIKYSKSPDCCLCFECYLQEVRPDLHKKFINCEISKTAINDILHIRYW